MFNLIMHGREWSSNRDIFPGSRLFEYTEDRIVSQFRLGSQPDFSALSKLPTLFAYETYGKGDQVARVGRIVEARHKDRDIALEYYVYPDISPIPNNLLAQFAPDLDIRSAEFSRTHWAVKDANLFEVLLRTMQPRKNRPTVFQISDPEAIEPSLISAMMPFAPSFGPVYDTLQSVAISLGMRCRRADDNDIWKNPAIIQDIVSLIDRARVVIADCSQRNPNVFYEIGIAHTLGREVILITQTADDVPFDLRHLRYIPYLNNDQGRLELAKTLEQRLKSLLGL